MKKQKLVTKSQKELLKKLKIIRVNDEEYIIQLKTVGDKYLEKLIEIAKDAQILFLRIEPEDIPRLAAKHIELNADEFNTYFYCDTIAEAPIDLLESYGIQSILVDARNNPNARKMGIQTYKSIYRQLSTLVSDIPKTLEEKERFKEVYQRLAMYIEYDHEAIEENSAYAVENEDTSRNLENAVLRNKAVCTGFAETLKQTLSLVDVESTIVYSLEDEEGNSHAYNLVKIQGKWYNADLTWDYKRIRRGSIPRFCLKSDKEFIHYGGKNEVMHIPEDITTPKCDTSLEVFGKKEEKKTLLKRLYALVDTKREKTEKQPKALPEGNTTTQFRDAIKVQAMQKEKTETPKQRLEEKDGTKERNDSKNVR